jgi:uroporphyrinogen decarboxylase
MSSIYRERFAATLAHQPVDRCPIDLGGTPQSTCDSQSLVERLSEYLGFAGEAPVDYDKFDRRLLEHWGIDLRRCGGLVPFTTGRQQVISEQEYVDCFGIRYRYSGLYWDIVGNPLSGSDRDQVAAYELPRLEEMSPGVLDDWTGRARALREETPYVVVGGHPVFGVLELACWLCGYEHLMMMLALDPEYIHLLFEKILEFQKMVIREYYRRLGRYLHVTTSGDDFGTQQGPFISPAMWRQFVKPYMQERIAYTTRFTDAVYLHHSCGSIFDIIPDLAEIGVGILNPIQPAAVGMDPQRLKSTYGRAIVFHGGLDTQDVLPSNDPQHIRLAVERLLRAMHPWVDGGYIFAPAHNLQVDVSPAAVAAMYDAAHEVSRQESALAGGWA